MITSAVSFVQDRLWELLRLAPICIGNHFRVAIG